MEEFAVQPEYTDPQDLARHTVDVLSDMKGEDIVLMDLREITHITDYFVICTANSDRQIKAMTEKVALSVREEFGIKPARIEGKAESGWLLIDYLDFVVHVFSDTQRRYYDLEEFWKEAKVLLRMK